MTRDDIIRLAREAELFNDDQEPLPEHLERFAALIAAAEREACAKIADKLIAILVAQRIRARGNTGIKWEIEP